MKIQGKRNAYKLVDIRFPLQEKSRKTKIKRNPQKRNSLCNWCKEALHSVKWHNLESFYPIKNNIDTWFPLDDNESFFLSSLYSDCDKILLIGNLTSKPLAERLHVRGRYSSCVVLAHEFRNVSSQTALIFFVLFITRCTAPRETQILHGWGDIFGQTQPR